MGGIDDTDDLGDIAPSRGECILHRRCVGYLKSDNGAAKSPLFGPSRKFGYPKPFTSSAPGKDSAMWRKSSGVMSQLIVWGLACH
jgi:hypothetical protein